MTPDLFTPRTMEELSMTWPSDLDHISASSLKMACRCPLRSSGVRSTLRDAESLRTRA